MNKKILLVLTSILICILIFGCTDRNVSESNDGEESSRQVNEEKNDQSQENQIEITEDEGTENNEESKSVNEENPEIKEGIFVGDRAPDFTILDREGNEISLSNFKGKPIFLNFWASWCPPCVEEMPYIQNIYNTYKDKDVVVLAINVTAAEKNGEKDTNEFLEKNNYTFPVLLDIEGEAASTYGIRYFPTSYFIDENGIIVNTVVGGMTKEKITDNIEMTIKQGEY